MSTFKAGITSICVLLTIGDLQGGELSVLRLMYRLGLQPYRATCRM